MKQWSKIILVTMLAVGMMFTLASTTFANTGIDEQFGEPILGFGEKLTEDQKDEVRRYFEVDANPDAEFLVTGQDNQKYINGNPNSGMYSSVKITHKEAGNGIAVNIMTPDHITKVTSDMYRNALLTAGVEDALIEVASPVQVTGHSALVGIYKAYDVSGADLDEDRMEVANDELNLTTKISSKEGISEEQVTALMTEIKKVIAEEKPATKEDVARIVQEQLDKLEIQLSDEDRQLLIDLFEKMRDLNIDFGKVKDQLNDLTNSIKDKLGDVELNLDEDFWDKVKNFFNSVIDKISSLFK